MSVPLCIQKYPLPFRKSIVVPWNDTVIAWGTGRGFSDFSATYSVIYQHIQGEWLRRETSGCVPDARIADKAAIHVVNDQMYVVGDTYYKTLDHNIEVHSLDIKTWTWKKLAPKGKMPSIMSSGMSSWSYRGKLYFFGGLVFLEQPLTEDGCDYLSNTTMDLANFCGSLIIGQVNQLFCYNIDNNTWEWPGQSGDIPSPRSGPSTIICDDNVFLFGGRNDKLHELVCFNDLHILDMEKMSWRKVHDTIEDVMVPSRHASHTFTRISQSHAILFGSVYLLENNRTVLKDDCWLLDLKKAKLQEEPSSIWTRIRNHFPRKYHAAILEPISQRLWIMDGSIHSDSRLLKMTQNMLSLKEICLNWMNSFIHGDDARLLPNEFPLQLKNEIEVYRKKIAEAYWCNKEKGCTHCQRLHERGDP